MKKIFYWLLLPCLLLFFWLMLNRSLSPGHIAFGLILSLLLAWAAMALRPVRSRPKRPLTIMKLAFDVLVDIIRSNIDVAVLIWRGPDSHIPRFLKIPIALRDPHALALLSCIITYIPGTVWSGFSEDKGFLILHVFDLRDEDHWINLVQQRYERPLKEIFE